MKSAKMGGNVLHARKSLSGPRRINAWVLSMPSSKDFRTMKKTGEIGVKYSQFFNGSQHLNAKGHSEQR